MDLSFSSKPNVLIPSGSYINFHLRRLPRKEFLGCGIQMRPPGPEFRTARRIPEQTHPTRCVVLHDSLYDGSIIAIAASVAVFAAMDFVYTNRSSERNVGSDFDVEGTEPKISVTLACIPLTKDSDNSQKDSIGKHVLANKARCTVPAVFDERNLTSSSPVVLSSVKDQTFIGKDGEFLSPRTNVLSKVDALKDQLNVGQLESTEKHRQILDNSDFMSEKQEKTLLDNVYSLKAFHISNFFVIPVHCKQRDFCPSQHYGTLQHTDDKRELPDLNNNGDLCRFTKEAYGCNEELDFKALSCFNSLNEKPLNLIIQRNGGCYDDFKQSMRKAEVLEKRGKSVLSERQDLFMCIQKAFRSNDKETSKRQLSTKEIDKNLMWKRENKYSSVLLHPLGTLVEDSSNLETCLITYERLLRDVRLKDCVDLLERMERKGLLDMDKIHHTRFLTACKRQKAVKEAFRFFKMINKPKLSTFNMLLSVCANSQDFDGAFEVMLLIKEARLKPDCKLYTTLISACGKCEKVDAMFEVFHEMLSSGIDANANTYGALIDGCARVGQVAKAFGAYGIMRSKNVQPDRVVFNALITACGRSGALDRAFDVLAEMKAEPKPIEPDHITIGALLKACIQAGQTHRAREVYKMLQLYNIKGTPDVYTIAVNSCSQTGDLNFALMIYDDMKRNGVEPDEMFLSTIIDAAGHAQNVDTAFSILKDARSRGVHIGSMTYSSLMGACCNAKNWKKALTLYEEIKTIKLLPTVSTLNALVTALCDGDQLPKSVEVLDEMKKAGVLPTVVTYSILIVACEKKDEAELGFALLSKAKDDGILPNLIMCRCLTGLCLQAYAKACSLGEPIVSFNSGRPQIDSIWTSRAIMVYRETISSGEIPTIEVFSQVLGCLQFPRDSLLRSSFIENLGVTFDASRCSNISSFLHGFGEYDSRSFSVLEEAASLRVVPRVSLKENPIVLDARKLLVHTVEVYILTILKGFKYRLAAGARLPCMIILMPRGKTVIGSPNRERTVYIATRVGQVVGSLLRRLGLPYQGDESRGRIRINGLTLRRWFRPKLSSFSSIIGRPGDMIPPSVRLAKGIAYQQRSIRSSDLSVDLD